MDAMYLYLAMLGGGVLAWSWILALRSGLGPDRSAALFLAAAATMLVAPILYGQREHVLIILAMSWFVGHVLGHLQSGAAAVGQTAVASLGLCLKPHFLLIPAGLTLAECLRTRSLRPVISASNLTTAVAGVVYVTFVVVQHPAYFGQLVPIALNVYRDYSFGAAAVLQTAQLWLLALLLVVALAGRR